MNFGGFSRAKGSSDSRKLRRDWRTLLKLSESPVPSRAITLICDKVSSLEYSIAPAPAFADNGVDYTQQIDTVRRVLDNPNIEDEDWPTMIRQVVEDMLVFDFGCWEYIESPSPAPLPNNLLSLVPVPGWSIERTIAWNGEPDKPRWLQVGANTNLPLLNSQIEAIIMRRRTSVSYGLSPMEVTIGLMDAYLKLGSYQANVASEAYPAFMISLGETTNQGLVDQVRAYWERELQGRSTPGVIGGFTAPSAIQTKAITDDGLYLKYWEVLIRILSFSFKLKPQDFNIERDVNRGQGELSQAASIEEAVKPYAIAIAGRVTRRVIPRIAELAGDPQILELTYEYLNIDPWDEMEQTNLATKQWQTNGITHDEYRQALGYEACEDGTGDMYFSEIAAQWKVAPTPVTESTDKVNAGLVLTAAKKKL